MKILLILFILLGPLSVSAHEGIPFFINYPSSVYQAHNRNFDVVCTSNGHVYIANFEGILHYDYNHWEILYTPGYSRVTRLYSDSKGQIWVGGYNVFGRITHDYRGCLTLQTIPLASGEGASGELEEITESDGTVYVKATSGKYYIVKGDSLLVPITHVSEKVLTVWHRKDSSTEINQTLNLPNGWIVKATEYNGLIVTNAQNERLFALTEQNGLCSNTVSHIATDGKGNLWGTTDNGVFCVFLPSMFSRYTTLEGLKGEVISILRHNGQLYVGTLQGLYLLRQNAFSPIAGIKQACWSLCISPDNRLYAATSDGVFVIHDNLQAERLVEKAAFSLLFTGTREYLLGTMDGIYKCKMPGMPERVADVEKVLTLEKKENSSIEARTLYGEVYLQKTAGTSFVGQLRKEQEAMTFYTDEDAYCWRTDLKGKNLLVQHPQNNTDTLNHYLNALRNYVVRVIYVEEKNVAWFGGDFGLVRLDLQQAVTANIPSPKTFLRQINLNRDSIFRGSFFAPDGQSTQLSSEMRNVRFSFATDAACFTETNLYRYKLDGYDADWSSWSEVDYKEYANLSSGNYSFKVQSKDIYGNESEVETLMFTLLPPFYLKWYSLLMYVLVFIGLIYMLFRWRMRKLLHEKEKLEEIVTERTQQLVEQKNEIEEKSHKLATTLNELEQAQDNLLRQEKLATVGKLTQGLIDRILNPLNYINNFSHLTVGLVQDLHKNLEDAKEQLDEDTYLDSLDVVDMMADNLAKIEEHGGNTTRILKAMEEVLRNQSKRLEKLELVAICEKCIEQLNTFYSKEIGTMHISVNANLAEKPLYINGNTEQLGKMLMSLLNNGMYAVIKKYNKKAYEAEVRITVEQDEDERQVKIILHDNGIGIEATILDKIFDPFFTTKTTGEAAGVGLYLGKEVVLNHDGQITVSSQKDEYTEFVIILPFFKE